MNAVIFDLDGTMIDNMMVHHRAWQSKLAEYGIEMSVEEVQSRIHGVNIEILEREFPGQFTVDERIQIAKEKQAIDEKQQQDILQLQGDVAEIKQMLQKLIGGK